jgi:DNA topoisomerase-2
MNVKIASISNIKVEITELPVRIWTQTFKENTMEPMLNGSEKNPALIQDNKEYHKEKTVKFIVHCRRDDLQVADNTLFHGPF